MTNNIIETVTNDKCLYNNYKFSVPFLKDFIYILQYNNINNLKITQCYDGFHICHITHYNSIQISFYRDGKADVIDCNIYHTGGNKSHVNFLYCLGKINEKITK